MKQAGDLHI